MNRVLVAACLVLVACKQPVRAPPPAPAKPTPCKAMRTRQPDTATDYTCPDPAAAARCATDVIACTPVRRTRGTVPPGGRCRRGAWDPDARAFELDDDCAVHPGTTDAMSPKGSICVMESGPGAYCTHACRSDADCADLVRPGFVATCGAGLCLLGG